MNLKNRRGNYIKPNKKKGTVRDSSTFEGQTEPKRVLLVFFPTHGFVRHT